MARPQMLEENVVISTRIEKEMYQMLHDIAAIETMTSGKYVGVQELIRNALSFVYKDGERLRECFRRSRSVLTKRRFK
jgi:hypothetical protein